MEGVWHQTAGYIFEKWWKVLEASLYSRKSYGTKFVIEECTRNNNGDTLTLNNKNVAPLTTLNSKSHRSRLSKVVGESHCNIYQSHRHTTQLHVTNSEQSVRWCIWRIENRPIQEFNPTFGFHWVSEIGLMYKSEMKLDKINKLSEQTSLIVESGLLDLLWWSIWPDLTRKLVYLVRPVKVYCGGILLNWTT